MTTALYNGEQFQKNKYSWSSKKLEILDLNNHQNVMNKLLILKKEQISDLCIIIYQWKNTICT